MKTTLWIGIVMLTASAVAAQGIGPGAAIPAVANLPGLAGTFWQSDLSVHNPDDTATSFRILLFAEIRGGAPEFEPITSESFSIPADGQVTLTNIVQTVFGKTNAKGAASVISEDGGPLVVGSRTYTFGDDGGSYGQEVFGVLVRDSAWASGARDDASYRTNLGVFLPVQPATSATFTVTVRGNDGDVVSTGALVFNDAGLQQKNLSAFGVGLLFDGSVEVTCDDPDLAWYGYLSRVDQISGDAVYRPLRGRGF